jgi:hypothetical protein
MSFVFMRLNNTMYKGYELFYKTPIKNNISTATEFNDYYYYYKMLNDESKTMVPLGKFTGFGKRNSGSPYNDYDYEVYEFEKDFVYKNKSNIIFSVGIPQTDENMTCIEGMFYQDYPIYYKNTKNNEK